VTAATPTNPTTPTAPATTTAVGRAFDLYRRTATERSAVVLVVANAIPVIGVLFFGWSLITILVLFWIENGIVGLWNIPRILLARGSILQSLPDMPMDAAMDATGNAQAAATLQARWRAARGQASPIDIGSVGRAGMALFFLVHYGMFWFVHGIFVFNLPSFAGLGGRADCIGGSIPTGLPSDVPPELLGGLGTSDCASPFGTLVWSNVAIAAAALFISHGASFFLNYLGKREYMRTSAAKQMFAPYSRVVMLHLAIILGAFLIAFLGAPIGALLVLVVLKTAFDLGLHLREHGAAS
jgi:Family of unknown function (DUF6498)